MTTECIFAG